jgi:palmitoyltransferase ZDHHC9/14/18
MATSATDDVERGEGSRAASPTQSRRSLSQDSQHSPNLVRSNSGTSTRSTRSRTQRLAFTQLSTPGTAPVSPPRPGYSGGTHASGIQPPAGFFRPSRPNIPSTWNPPDAPFNLLSATTVPDESNFPNLRKEPSQSSLPRDREPSPITWDQSPDSTFAERKRPARLQLSREQLLPIGGGTPKRPQHVPTSSISGTSDIRSSFDKIFRRRSTETGTSTPGRQMKSVIPLHGPLPEDIHISKDIEGAMVLQPSTPRTPRTPKSLRTPRSPRSDAPYMYNPDARGRHQGHDLEFHPYPPGKEPVRKLPTRYVYNHTTRKKKRNYEGYPSNNIFFFGGRLLTGGKRSPMPFIGTVVVVLGLAGAWAGTTAVWWVRRGGGSIAVAAIGAYIAALAILNMFVTVGIIFLLVGTLDSSF